MSGLQDEWSFGGRCFIYLSYWPTVYEILELLCRNLNNYLKLLTLSPKAYRTDALPGSCVIVRYVYITTDFEASKIATPNVSA
jgi:hypothetical protein